MLELIKSHGEGRFVKKKRKKRQGLVTDKSALQIILNIDDGGLRPER